MPAVELMRLRIQINGLLARFGDPASFRSALKDFLDLHSDRAYRPGTVVQAQPLLPGYRVAPLVLRQLELELGRTCQEQPDQALGVVEALWRDTHLEPRLLATTLLGAIPISHGAGVLMKLREWTQPEENFRILDALYKNGTIVLRRSSSSQLLQLVGDWVNSQNVQVQSLGVRALTQVVKDELFENLPAVYRLLSPLVQVAPTPLQPDLYEILQVLIKRSPTETAYFLRQNLSLAAGPGTARLIRRCLSEFGPAQQTSLRAALRAANPP